MAFAGWAEIVFNEMVKPGLYLMRVRARELAGLAKPGQFVHVRCGSTTDPLLRRPISLHGIDYGQGTISLLYQVVGKGTRLLAGMRPGQELEIMGPLGRGFSVPDKVKDVLVIGGGIGAAPLFPLVQELKRRGVAQTIILGARSADLVIGAVQLASLGVQVHVATDDGSMGKKGLVTDLAGLMIKRAKPDYFYACGPKAMLRAVQQLMGAHGIKGQLSLEEYMGCGVGACLACVCKTAAQGAGHGEAALAAGGSADFEYKKICTDGPVFDAGEVVLDD